MLFRAIPWSVHLRGKMYFRGWYITIFTNHKISKVILYFIPLAMLASGMLLIFCCFCCWKFIFLARNLNKNPTRIQYVSTHTRYIPDTYPTHTRYIWIPREYSPNIPHISHEYPIAHSSIVEAWRVPLLKHPQWNISRKPDDGQNEQKSKTFAKF